VNEDALAAARAAIDGVEGLESLPCDGAGHPIPDAAACFHVRCTLPSPAREELLARVAPVVRRAKFVLAALVDRRDLYSVSWKPPKRGGDVAGAAARLAELLADPEALDSGHVPDRRGR
jgi:hypothetical protein